MRKKGKKVQRFCSRTIRGHVINCHFDFFLRISHPR